MFLHEASRNFNAPKMSQLGRYLLVGGAITTIGYAAIFFCMYVIGWSPLISNIVVYGLGIAASYWANRNYTFRSDGKKVPEAMRFLVVFAFAYSANLVALALFISNGVHPAVSQVIGGGVYVLTTFSANKLFVFKS